jgi:hypothetical protein
MKTLFFFIILFSNCFESKHAIAKPGPRDKDEFYIDMLYAKLSKNKYVNKHEIKGDFAYVTSDSLKHRYVANFFSAKRNYAIKYFSNSAEDKDQLKYNKIAIELRRKWDPLTMRVCHFKWKRKNFIYFLGKARSASGAGVQLTYYCLIELTSGNRVLNYSEFESRFGNSNNIISYKNSLDYFKIVNGKKSNEYMLTINDIKSDKQIEEGSITLSYQLDDKFSIVGDQLSKKLK